MDLGPKAPLERLRPQRRAAPTAQQEPPRAGGLRGAARACEHRWMCPRPPRPRGTARESVVPRRLGTAGVSGGALGGRRTGRVCAQAAIRHTRAPPAPPRSSSAPCEASAARHTRRPCTAPPSRPARAEEEANPAAERGEGGTAGSKGEVAGQG